MKNKKQFLFYIFFVIFFLIFYNSKEQCNIMSDLKYLFLVLGIPISLLSLLIDVENSEQLFLLGYMINMCFLAILFLCNPNTN